MKKLAIILGCFIPFLVFGQQPYINSISPQHIEVGQIVTISGSNLGGTVLFGGVQATFTGSGNVIEATVPAGATQGPVTVINNGLLAQSSQHFFISFSGSTITTYEAESLFETNDTDANGICICDLDTDGLNDAIIAHSVGDASKSEISIFENQSTLGGVANFVRVSEFDGTTSGTDSNNADNLSGFISVTCDDLDNDGLPELIFTTNQGTNSRHIYIYKNHTSGDGDIDLRYQGSLSLKLPDTDGGDNRVPREIKVRDMDGDGLSDLIVGNDTDNTLHIFLNTSSGSISFAAATEIDADGDLSGVIDVADLDNDGRPEIISMPFRENSTRIHILKNNSIVDNLSFEAQASVTNGGQTNNVKLGDLDDDGFIDIIVASRNTGLITTFRNSTAGSTITFDTGVNLTLSNSSPSPFGIDLGDINGDGLVDIVSAFAGGSVYVIPNTSTSGISFGTDQEIATTSTTQNIRVGDLNGDAKPDIAYSHDVSVAGPIGDLGVFINRNCMEPVLSPTSTQSSFCDTPDTFTLFATESPGATYNWTVPTSNNIGTGGNSFATATNSATFEIGSGSTATIRVTITSADGSCTTEFAEQTYSLASAITSAPTIQISQAGVLCVGDNVTISTSTTYDTYFWTLPDGSTSTSATINLSSVEASDAGTYSVLVQNSGLCTSGEVTQSIEVAQPPSPEIFNNGNDTFCDDGANDPVLEVSPISGVTYQWKRNGSNISGATNATYTATETGNYTVEITDGNMCTNESVDAYTVTEITQPVASFTGPSETCVDFTTTYTATSTAPDFTPVHSWVVEDATNTVVSNTTGSSLDFSFPAVGTYDVILTTAYNTTDVDACSDSQTMSVTVSAAPTITFSVPEDTEKCQGDALTVGITSPVAADIASYEWSINGVLSSGTTADATTLTGVDSVYAVVTITTSIGCTVQDSVKIKNFPTDADISSSLFDLSNDSVTLEDDNFVELTAENIASEIAWSPASIINDTTLSTVTVFPASSPTIVTLTGIDGNGCAVSSQVTIILDNIRPRRTFSPNGDGQGFDCWEILNTSELTGCKVYVFDSRGKNILVADSPFENNCVWDGNYNGAQVPEGLYYFVLKCDDSSLSKSGSILLAR